MTGTEKVVKHLEMIQTIINRLGKNSFWVKGASLAVIITTAIITPRGPNVLPDVLSLTVLIPIILGFWTLDSYYLWQERLFRQIHKEVQQQTDTDFSMDVSKHKAKPECNWASTVFSVTLIVFYAIEIVFTLFITGGLAIFFMSIINSLEGIG